MKENKFLLSAALLTLCASLGFAQEIDDFDSFDSFSEDSSSSSPVSLSGSSSLDLRAYTDSDSAEDTEIEASPSAALNLNYSGNKSDFTLSLKVDEDTIKNHPEDVIDEMVLRAYFGNFMLEGGKMKLVWGKGDKLHVIDNFNADDYSDFIIPDYLDRRISTPMVRGVYSLPFANMNLEAVYTPFLPVDRFSTSGRWTPAQVSNLTSTVKDYAKSYLSVTILNLESARMEAQTAQALKEAAYAGGSSPDTDSNEYKALSNLIQTAYADGNISYTSEEVLAYCSDNGLDPTNTTYQQMAVAAILAEKYEEYLTENLVQANTAYNLALSNASLLSADSSVLYPDLWTLKYGQFGARATWTMGQVDMGLSYYNGWFKQPSINGDKIYSCISNYMQNGYINESDKFLSYDKKQTFGLEASTVIWHFNLRGEFAYNLTDDIEGNDPWVQNNSIAWLGGFDIDLPFWNANLNVQEYGSYTLKEESNNKLVCNFTTAFMNDKILPEVTLLYGIEKGDLVLLPKITIKPDQNLSLVASGMWIHCKDDQSEFAAWKDNSFVSLGAQYCF